MIFFDEYFSNTLGNGRIYIRIRKVYIRFLLNGISMIMLTKTFKYFQLGFDISFDKRLK